ncbi:hypothetical protein C343_06958 [Cryptococcus neoformans C23]|uniref:Uncharacterized protein n=2 Tax=Cryptococcus neoformans TaxID=5207 RepID=A0A854QM72_CRYNE|nr:hypothetical protein CNAG_07885 [Cryptococcus neoformans var. grubii H99]AUB29194.1 hypothetical protein CKF44_07885 [Cryptococcus neoformans var. grubii]OWZ25916.1 hypothetical protein C347_06885 [Cryptococcus neoformans var. grubii AD2-60a]OWZ26189.1 hypothetical protein C353_06996 [Cryptococcus neoformans var. grubii AD1-83a]OWZ37945.1 hypothetical protein C343_06958 [Cryptococcus neoformans var. grubii C23]OWZ49687.1 hypothetical protein C368_06961 [Cryptococcus neoformans var. grubii 1|eukprot:XP_012053935.1 hypothetical protein CNAG_07885 [Cryptococcus neoformans var. grubii H99]
MSSIHHNPSSKAKMSKPAYLINSSRRSPPMSLMAMEDRGLNKKHESHKEYKELKMTTLSLERERLAGDKARLDWEEQSLEEHRRTERRMKEEEMECRQKCYGL